MNNKFQTNVKDNLSQTHFRAVVGSLPSRFSVSHFLSTGPSSGRHHHGMHISSNIDGSLSSQRSLYEYDIARSWEDCLFFQQSLEVEYERAAHEKKRRLKQGKGVKGFNGMYKHDMASSWESLPPGPTPDSVTKDIHKYLPSLTRRGTVFRASQATINQRQTELVAFIGALFSDDIPTLIQEIRASALVADFMGHWQRDFQHAEEYENARSARRNSLTESVASFHFSTSHSLVTSSQTSAKIRRQRSQLSTPRPCSATSLNEISEEPRIPCGSMPRSRSRPHSTSSDSSFHSESSSDTSLVCSSDLAIAEDVPIVFGHNPLNPTDRPSSILEVLQEEWEMFSKSPEPYQPVKCKPGASAIDRKANRSYSFFGLSLKESLPPAERSDDCSVRESWQTTDSQDSTANELLDGIGLTLPHPIKEQKFRASIASISTFMTTDSSNAVIPQTPKTKRQPFISSADFSTAFSISDFDVYSDTDDNCPALDAFPRPITFIPGGPESPLDITVGDLSLPDSPSSTRTAFNRPASPTCSTMSSSGFSATTSSSSAVDSIFIKAIYGTSIILLRVSRGTSLADVRQRLYNKFIGQEAIPLSQAYNITFVPHNPERANGACSKPASAKQADVQLIILESDWEQLMSTLQGSKITLRILDTSPA